MLFYQWSASQTAALESVGPDGKVGIGSTFPFTFNKASEKVSVGDMVYG